MVSWPKFARQFWEKKPTVFRERFETPLFPPEEVFCALRRAAADDSAPRTVWVDQVYVPSARDRVHLPSNEDKSFTDYCCGLPSADVCVVHYELQRYSPEIWMRARGFLLDVMNVVGLPTKADIDVFYGRYRATPRGPHTDTAGNFSFVIEGRKKMLMWPPGYFESRRLSVTRNGSDGMKDIANPRSYHRFAKDAVVLEGGPGDVLYWPSSYWHMAVSEEFAPTMALNIALYVREQPAHILTDIAASALGEILMGSSEFIDTFTTRGKKLAGSLRTLPDEYRFLLGTLRTETLSLAIRKAWLRHVSALAFKSLPPPENNVELGDKDTVVGRNECPIVWIPAGDRWLMFAANGACFVTPNSPALLRAFSALNAGKCLQVGDFHTARAVREALRLLLANRAIRVTSA